MRERLAGELGRPATILAAAVLMAVLFMGSTLLTPLYALYREKFGFSILTLTLIYAAYVIGNMSALWFLGRISDQVGRRKIALLSIGISCLSAVVFLGAAGLAALFAARILGGLAIGLGAGAASAWIADLMEGEAGSHAAAMATGANFLGLAFGPALAGPLAEYAPWPLRLSFVVYLGLLILVAALTAFGQETVRASGGWRIANLRPRLGVPSEIRDRFLAPAVTVFGTMALIGFYAALTPTVLREDLRIDDVAEGAAIVSGLFLTTAAAIVATRRLASRPAMLAGLALLPPSLALLAAAQLSGRLAVLIVGAATAGLAAAFGYRGSLQVINQIAPEDRRAEVTSAYFLCGFAGNALPVIGVGLVTVTAGPKTASVTFALAIAAFALGAIAWDLKYAGR